MSSSPRARPCKQASHRSFCSFPPGRSMDFHGRQRGFNELLSLPQELLQLVLQDVPNKYALRATCKAFSKALATCCGGITLNNRGLAARGPRREISDAVAAFPNAGRVVLSFDCAHTRHYHGARGLASSTNNIGSTGSRASDKELLAESLEALQGHSVSSLALLHLAFPMPPPSVLTHQRATLVEFEVSDSSYSRAAEQGAFNVLVRQRDSLAHGDAMVAAALSLPQLRRVSLASAAFSADSVAALGSLTRLDALSIAGSLECPGGTAQAAATYRTLLQQLSALRQLRLPMAVDSCGSAFLDDDDDGGGHFHAAEWSDNDLDNNRSGVPSSLPPLATTSSLAAVFGGAAAPVTSAGVPRAFAGGKAVGLGGLWQQKRSGSPSELAVGFVFPPHLQDLTIPLCSFNRPVFEAACAAYARVERTGMKSDGSAASELEQGRASSKPAAIGDGVEPVLVGPGPPNGRGGAAGAGMAPLGHAKGGDAGGSAASSASHQGATGSAKRPPPSGSPAAGSLRSLHIPTVAGYSHWEGSFLASVRDFEQLARLTDLEVLHVSLDMGSFQLSRDSMRTCFQHLRALRSLRELRISEARQPLCFSMRKRSSSGCGAAAVWGAALPASLSDPALEQLQRQWPRLRTLQFFAETVVRSRGRLVVPSGLGDVDLLPCPCACCSGPHLLAAPRRSLGRWTKNFDAAGANAVAGAQW